MMCNIICYMKNIKLFDVQKLLTELWANPDLSDAKIGKALSIPAATIFRLRTGRHKDPGLFRGIQIHNFHVQFFRLKKK